MAALVGLGCTRRVGKDTVAARLVDRWGFTRVAFADPIRDLALRLNPKIHGHRLSWWVDKFGWETAKGNPEVRMFLVDIGVECRAVLGEDVWLDAALRRIGELLLERRPVVVTDVRFPNEVAALRDLGATLIEVVRPGSPDPEPKSEPLAGTGWYDETLFNTEDIAGLNQVVDHLVRYHNWAPSVMVYQHSIDPTILDTVDLMGAGTGDAGPDPRLIERLVELVDELRPEHREVLEALYFERCGQRELARRLGVSRSTVCRRQAEALEKVRVALEEEL